MFTKLVSGRNYLFQVLPTRYARLAHVPPLCMVQNDLEYMEGQTSVKISCTSANIKIVIRILFFVCEYYPKLLSAGVGRTVREKTKERKMYAILY